MNDNPKSKWPTWLMDGLLFGATVALLALCLGLIVAWAPSFWGQCVTILDARSWGQGTWTGVGLATLASLLLTRLWPEKKRG